MFSLEEGEKHVCRLVDAVLLQARGAAKLGGYMEVIVGMAHRQTCGSY